MDSNEVVKMTVEQRVAELAKYVRSLCQYEGYPDATTTTAMAILAKMNGLHLRLDLTEE